VWNEIGWNREQPAGPAGKTRRPGVRDQPQQRRLETRRLADLRAFDVQGDFFEDLPEHELQALADDIDRNGLRQPIEVLPENDAGIEPDTILSGRQRKRALELPGGTTTRVCVRYDPAHTPRHEIDRAFLEDHQNRRQLDLENWTAVAKGGDAGHRVRRSETRRGRCPRPGPAGARP
jgi:hypothetical protein